MGRLFVAAGLSGCAALLNQILWTRQLGLVFGSTIEAVSVVTAVFMGGLALGSALAPRVARADRDGARSLFERLEAGLAAASIALAFALPALEGARASFGSTVAWSIAIALLLGSTTLMGMTLVVLTRGCAGGTDEKSDAGVAGRLFGVNTLGAVAGVYGATLVFLPALGLTRSAFFAASLNAVAAALARSVAVSSVEVRSESPARGANPEGGAKKKRENGRDSADGTDAASIAQPLVLAALFVAGFAGLASEVAWTRGFILVAGPTAYGFSFVLGGVVLGLAVGALAASYLIALVGARGASIGFGVTQALVGAASLRVLYELSRLPVAYGESVRRLVEDATGLLWLQARGAWALVFVPAFLSGALFPFGVRLLRGSVDAARAVSRASVVNTVGAITGALLAGFVLLPSLGLEGTMRLSAGASILAGLATLAFSGSRVAQGVATLGCVVASFASTRTATLDRDLFAGGAYKYSVYDTALPVEDVLRRGELVYYREGRLANVSVKRVGDTHSLAIDGKVDATSGGDMLTQRLLAHAPLLIHPRPRTALVIGLGSGVTAGAALKHDVHRVTAVEILPEVVETARTFFGAANDGALDDPRLDVVVGDARLHVLSGARSEGAAGPANYDVVISEPSNPWMAGVSPLFTREFFSRVGERLSDGGVFCQWGHLYNMAEDDLATLLAGFRDVFPNAAVFVISEADILIVGQKRGTQGGADDPPPAFDPGRIAPPGAIADLAASKISAEGLRAIPRVTLRDLSPWLDPAARHTDDRPILEFRAPRAIHAQTAAKNRARLLSGLEPPQGPLLVERLESLLAVDSTEWAFELALDAARDGSTDPRVLLALVKSAVKLGRVTEVVAALQPPAGQRAAATRLHALGLAHWNASRPDLALESLRLAVATDPKFAPSYHLAAEIQSAAGNLQPMRQILAGAFAIDRRDPVALALAAEAEFKDGRFEPAIRLAQGALQFDANEARALEILALALVRLERRAEARAAFQRLVASEPQSDSARANFGVFELEEGNAAAALRLFKDAVDLNPGNRLAYQGLQQVATTLGRADLQAAAARGLARVN